MTTCIEYRAYGMSAHDGRIYVERVIDGFRIINKWNRDSSRMKDKPYLYVIVNEIPKHNVKWDELTWHENGGVHYGVRR